MYLKRLEIQGFKSFADKVDFEFSSGITAIVGPNGSGKSNVVDSIRWVLGEQSAKSLRGGKMDDVIFAGSVNRRAVGMAQVSLTLDNSDGLFPLDYNEVTITRRLYRSGESEYLINNTSCRLKDIHELFMDTGLGKEGFSIISQGKVDEILSLKAEDRRGLIEEAAGIIKYKYRKREAERKLEGTEENMLRLNDIMVELSDRLEPLRDQADKAKNYQLWKHELDSLEISVELDKLEKNKRQEKQLTTEFAQAEDELARQMAAQAQIEAKVQADRLTLQNMDQAISVSQEAYYELQSKIETCEKEIALSIGQKENFREQDEKLMGEIAYFRQEAQEAQKQLAEKQQKQAQLSAQLDQQSKDEQDLAEQIDVLSEAVKKAEDEWQSYQSATVEAMRDQIHHKNECSHLRQEIQNQDNQLKRLSEKITRLTAEKDQVSAQVEEQEKTLYQLNEAYNSAQALLQEKRYLQQKYDGEQSQVRQKLEDCQKLYQQSHSRLQALKELEEAGEGYQAGVKSVLEQKKIGRLAGIVGTVAQLIQVPDYLEKAIETVLGAAVQNIVVESDTFAQQAIAFLKQHQKGRATFLPLNTVNGKKAAEKLDHPDILGLAVDLITFDGRYDGVMNQLLGRVWVVKNLAAAVAIGKQRGFNYRLVTLEGDLITPGGAMTGGNFAKQKGGLLSRQRQIAELENKAKFLQEEQKRCEKQLAEATQKYQQLLAEIDTLQKGEQEHYVKLQEAKQTKEERLKDKHRIANDMVIEEMEEQQIRQSNEELKRKLSVEEKLLEQASTNQKDLDEKIAYLKQQSQQDNQTLSGLKEKHQQSKIQLATDKERMNGFLEQTKQLENRQRDFTRQMTQKEAEQRTLLKRSSDNEQEMVQHQAHLQHLTSQQNQQNQALQEQKDQRQSLQELLDEAEKQAKDLQQQVDALKENRYKLDVALNKTSVQIDNGLEHLRKSFECSYEEALLRRIAIEDEKIALKRIVELKTAVRELGHVNLGAIEEHQQVQERLIFFTAQMEDLEQARASLNKVIKEMEQIMARKFKETYQVVNETFSSVFCTIFAGGQARLELSQPHDYLMTGIEIVAQPPGKKEQILSLLSGGERTMTAIALLFALLTVKPSPFCILDEVEAALDEVNVERFARFIKEYTSKTQFIVISHRKGTMEAADALYGVAMENNGVSRLMSVRLTDYQ